MRLLLLVLALVARDASAQSVDARLADLRLATSVRLALVRDAATRALDVEVTAQGGDVRLSPSPPAAVRVAQGVSGVRSVNGPGGAPERPPVADVLPAAEPVRSAPRTETPAAEAPRADPPRASAWGSAPRAETPRAETPRAETPQPEAPAEAAGPAVHVVGRGDTLFSLARRYGTTVEVLRRLNGLTGSAGIEIGQRLRLR